MLVDTHAHLHFADFAGDLPAVLRASRDNGVTKIITVGTDVESSRAALDLVARPELAPSKTGVQFFATLGLHPHSAAGGQAALDEITQLARLVAQNITSYPRSLSSTISHPELGSGSIDSGSESGMTKGPGSGSGMTGLELGVTKTELQMTKGPGSESGITNDAPAIVAIGECGLDYFKNHSSAEEQKFSLRIQIELAQELNLPLIFHVRDAWDDFFDILAEHKRIRGVIHSFTGGPKEVERANQLGLYFGLNGIMTFTRDQAQLEAARLIPADRLLLETDCPYLSPAPLRGRRNEPANIAIIARFLAELRDESFGELADRTTTNANHLFTL